MRVALFNCLTDGRRRRHGNLRWRLGGGRVRGRKRRPGGLRSRGIRRPPVGVPSISTRASRRKGCSLGTFWLTQVARLSSCQAVSKSTSQASRNSRSRSVSSATVEAVMMITVFWFTEALGGAVAGGIRLGSRQRGMVVLPPRLQSAELPERRAAHLSSPMTIARAGGSVPRFFRISRNPLPEATSRPCRLRFSRQATSTLH